MIKQSSKKAKGKLLEDFVSDMVVSKGIDYKARREASSGSGTRDKCDVVTSAQLFGRNLGIECKNQETLKIGEWWKQTELLEKLGMEPVLVYKVPRRTPKVVLVSIYLETFLDMVAALDGVDNVSSNLTENNHYDKTSIYNSLEYLSQSVNKLKNDYKKKILKEK